MRLLTLILTSLVTCGCITTSPTAKRERDIDAEVLNALVILSKTHGPSRTRDEIAELLVHSKSAWLDLNDDGLEELVYALNTDRMLPSNIACSGFAAFTDAEGTLQPVFYYDCGYRLGLEYKTEDDFVGLEGFDTGAKQRLRWFWAPRWVQEFGAPQWHARRLNKNTERWELFPQLIGFRPK